MENLGTRIIETERLILRRFAKDDAEGLFDWASNPNVTKYVSWNAYKTLEEAKENLEKWILKYEENIYNGKRSCTCGPFVQSKDRRI